MQYTFLMRTREQNMFIAKVHYIVQHYSDNPALAVSVLEAKTVGYRERNGDDDIGMKVFNNEIRRLIEKKREQDYYALMKSHIFNSAFYER